MGTTELLIAILGGSASAAIVSGVVQVILWKLNHKATKEDKETKHEKHIKNAICVILYDRIKYLGRRHLENGFITAEDLEDLMSMHKVYHDDLDGNGFLNSIMAQVKALPIRKEGRKDNGN